MNRQIKFRGQVTDTKKWVFGYYFNHAGIDRIFVPEKGSFTVIPETVGQFTGLTDKNGTEIYEGDCISSDDKYFVNSPVYWDVTFAGYNINPSVSLKAVVVGNIHQESEVTNG